MKIVKLTLSSLFIAIIIDCFAVYATTASSVFGTFSLERNNFQESNVVTKVSERLQEYYNQKTYTTLTNPCPNCEIYTQIRNANGDYSTVMFSKAGQRVTPAGDTVHSYPGNYYLRVKRNDVTLLTTYHFYEWFINNY